MKKKTPADLSISITVRPGRAGESPIAKSKITRHSPLGAPGEKQIQINLTAPSINLQQAEALVNAVIQKTLPARKGAVMARPARGQSKTAARRRA